MLRLITENGRIEIENPELTARLLEMQVVAQAQAEAEQQALMVVYRVGAESDELPASAKLLTERLDISERTARQLITEGRIGYTCCGKKTYRVTEKQVREFLGDLQQAS